MAGKLERDDVEKLRKGAMGAGLLVPAQLLRSKAPDDVDAYRVFVLDLARSVAASAPGGDEAEAGMVAKIEAALAAPSVAV